MPKLTLIEPFRALFYAPFYLAEARGLFAAEGLELRMVTAGSTDAAAEMLLAGAADFAWSGPMRPMLLRSRDPACTLRSFCAVVMRDPFLLMGATQRPGFTLAELPRLRLGLVSEVPTPVWCLKGDLARAGLAPDTLGAPAGPGMAENAAALAEGRLDVAQMFEPFACRVEDAGGHLLHAQASRGLTAYTAFYATEAGIAAQRPALMAAIRAMDAALRLIRTAPAAEIAALIAPRFPNMPEAHRTRAIARYQGLDLWGAGPRFPREAFETLGAAMLAAGAITHIPPFEDCVDEAIVAEALA
ncbi:ABC transporter substrate-binding protein [Belnapia sp. T6]|uniref:ABC transporter substrate-binding protein n=1 Tax=Belnapia mucosa TaxID=2804532 RepID=A0ABS1UXZ8_9PROT|nr:ABC transporter substrate-binding protein [Belnapia mucosa]MBL6454315.1 ABC transporter substrate-binding protein [Belnapia mucosa]